MSGCFSVQIMGLLRARTELRISRTRLKFFRAKYQFVFDILCYSLCYCSCWMAGTYQTQISQHSYNKSHSLTILWSFQYDYAHLVYHFASRLMSPELALSHPCSSSASEYSDLSLFICSFSYSFIYFFYVIKPSNSKDRHWNRIVIIRESMI